MPKQTVSIFLILLLIAPLVNTVSADGEQGPELEAKNFTAVVDSDNETTTLTWGNLDTNDFVILNDLKFTNYSLYRCLLYTSPSPRDGLLSRMPSSA